VAHAGRQRGDVTVNMTVGRAPDLKTQASTHGMLAPLDTLISPLADGR
jgi:hypothetical protein